MFSAMILGCVLDVVSNETLCMGFVSPYIFEDYESCVGALSVGAPVVEQKGWTIVSYQCYDWTQKDVDKTAL